MIENPKIQISKIKEFWSKKYEKSVHELEQSFSNAVRDGGFRPKDAMRATLNLVFIIYSSLDLIFILLTISVIVLLSGSLIAPSIERGIYGLWVLILTALSAAAVSSVFAFVVYPIHLLYNIKLPVAVAFLVVFTAAVASQFGLFYSYILEVEGVLGPFLIFQKMVVCIAVAAFFMLIRFKHIIDFNAYKIRHQSDTIFKILPAHIRGPLVAMSAQDHYVEITTKKGKHLHRMSMKNAIDMVPEGTGMQVHRSHWVAFSEMHALEKQAERFHLRIRSGAEIPVSKTKVNDIQNFFDGS